MVSFVGNRFPCCYYLYQVLLEIMRVASSSHHLDCFLLKIGRKKFEQKNSYDDSISAKSLRSHAINYCQNWLILIMKICEF